MAFKIEKQRRKRKDFKRWMNKEGWRVLQAAPGKSELKINGSRGNRRKQVAQEIHEGKERRVKVDRETARRRRQIGDKTRHEQIKTNRAQQKAARLRRSRAARR